MFAQVLSAPKSRYAKVSMVLLPSLAVVAGASFYATRYIKARSLKA